MAMINKLVMWTAAIILFPSVVSFAQSAEHEQRKQEYQEKMQAACSDDIQRLCQGQKNLHYCLARNRQSLSPSCADFVAEMRMKFHQHRGHPGNKQTQDEGSDAAAQR